MTTHTIKSIKAYIESAGYEVTQQGEKLIVKDPVQSNGKIVAYKDVILKNLQQAVHFVEERS